MQAASEREIYLIDAIGPFFRGYGKTRINWSKIPWSHLPTGTSEAEERFARIREDMATFASRVADVGYNAVSLDDLPHLADHPWYEPEIRERIQAIRKEFRQLFAIIREAGLDIYITTDIVSFTPALKERLGNSEQKINAFLAELIGQFFDDFPEVAGLILRIGESDGLDVKGEFRSELHLKNPGMVNRCLRHLLPVFEKHERLAIFRTWTVGAHQVGDLIWHRSTLSHTLRDLDSPALVISMKYGESDFFRFLPLNRNFFRTSLPKIVELQTRREYEGCGEYPSFIGWDYEQYARQLHDAENLIGISVWCQTGGWLPFRRLAYLEKEAIWTEINTWVTLRIFRDKASVEDAVRAFPGCPKGPTWLELLRLSDEVIKELLYLPEFAEQKLFFRRVRLPPLLGVYWHNIFANHSLKKIMSHFVRDGETAVRQGHAALEKIERMKELAERGGLPVEDIAFMEDTFRLLSMTREYFFLPYSEEMSAQLKAAKKAYKKKYPRRLRQRYAVKLDFKPFKLKGRYLAWAFSVLVRDQRGYRIIDRILSIHLLSFCYMMVRRTRPRLIPKFARKSAMGIDAVFR